MRTGLCSGKVTKSRLVGRQSVKPDESHIGRRNNLVACVGPLRHPLHVCAIQIDAIQIPSDASSGDAMK